MATKILIVDSHPISLAGLQTILDNSQDLEVVGAVQDEQEVASEYRKLRPDVVIVNTHAHASEALYTVVALSAQCPPLAPPHVLVLISGSAGEAHEVLRAGAKGLLSNRSSAAELAAAVRLTATGTSLLVPSENSRIDSPLARLTDREVEIFRLITRGFSNAEISDSLQVSESTVKSHIQHLMDKLGLRNRVHAVIFAYERNIVHTRS
ncbi:response regulator transcription factor [Streptomyces sp. NBC_01198]|uniref:response regulator transcription factor n=1 Tax=Streptomyces sp. NBC_01198 TaxID=2903769 RepID=UPI002E114957|nr:response regulator transcription factor [Streptomyces sp. NBC_01198]